MDEQQSSATIAPHPHRRDPQNFTRGDVLAWKVVAYAAAIITVVGTTAAIITVVSLTA